MTVNHQFRLAILVPHRGMSGAEKNIAELLAALGDGPFQGHIIAPDEQPLLKMAQDKGFIVHRQRFPRFLSTSVEVGQRRIPNPFALVYDCLAILLLSVNVAGLLKSQDIEVLYTGSMMAHFIGALARLQRRNLYLVVHMQEIPSSRLMGGVARLGLSFITDTADRIIVISRAVLAVLPASERSELIYNGVDLQVYTSSRDSTLAGELNLPADMPLVGVVGRLTPWKGHRIFLEAAASLVRANLRCHFVIIGDSVDPVAGESNYETLLENYCRELGLIEFVTFTGFRADIPNIMAGLDIVVVPSQRAEPFGLVAIEAMACSKPVVAANIGGLPEMVVDGQTGRLFPPGDSAALAGVLTELIANRVLCAEYGKAGRLRVEHFFTIEQYIDRMLAALQPVEPSFMPQQYEKA